jgi:hypothetical protein
MAFKSRIRPAAAAAAVGLAGLVSSAAAQAAIPTCADVVTSLNLGANPRVIYGGGGSAITPTLAKVALVLSQATPPTIVFYTDPGAQVGYDLFRDNAGAGKGTTTSPAFKYWLKAADLVTPQTCTATDLVAGQGLDFGTTGGNLSLFGESLPAGVAQFAGPAQGVNLIVPKDSTEASISTEALYFVFGFGDATQYAGATQPIPWTNKAYIIQRKSTSFVQQFIRGTIQTLGGNAATFPADFKNASTQTATCSKALTDSNGGTVECLQAAAAGGHAQDAIGFTSGPTADQNRATVHTLAYQHTGQLAGYWPDSTSDAFDKINIRTGQYYLWDVNQFFARINGSNANATQEQITNPDVKRFIGYFSGYLPPPADADVNRAIAETGSIPLCAMHVQRDGDFGALSCYAPPAPCDCYFESIATKSQTCDACNQPSDCNPVGTSDADARKCRNGFCEAY